MMASSALDLKRCGACGESKPPTAFYRHSGAALRSECADCTKERRRTRYRRSDRERHLKKTFGITEADYESMLRMQGGCCAICNADATSDGRAFRVDHDHATGRVRGLLCHSCNVAIGLLKENVAVLAKAITYIELSRQSA